MSGPEGLDYAASGVDISAGQETVERIRGHVARTHRPGVVGELGGFGGLFSLAGLGYRDPLLVSAADGVGTKLKIAFALGIHHTVGRDLVAMNVNDVLVQGGEPLFFLDYVAVGRLQPEVVEQVVKGLADGCAEAGCALLGGETAELPDFYRPGEYDLAGFCVGVVEREALVDGARVRPGDVLVGLASSGLHSNGYSLARKALLEVAGLRLDSDRPELGRSLGEELLAPTRIYVRPVLAALKEFEIRAMAHITGGGLAENLPRVLPKGTGARLDARTWPEPPVFDLIRQAGRVTEREMRRTFNLGIGFALVLPAAQAEAALRFFAERNLAAYRIGEIETGERGVRFVGG